MKVGQFVKISNGRLGVVVSNEESGDTTQGYCHVWFGNMIKNDEPLVKHLPIQSDWEKVATPNSV